MQCNCGAVSEATHKIQRSNKIVGEYQKCPSCGRILWLWKDKVLTDELTNINKEV